MATARVTAVIPTRGRPQLVVRAVNSALAQSIADIEIIVVVDGCDPATTELLSTIADARLRVVELPEPSGGSAARNAGVAAATAKWIAFLDDDDEWLPEKIELQLEAAAASAASVIVSCRLEYRTDGESYAGPRRLPRRGEPLGDYLLDRRSLFRDESTVLTSTLLAPRALLLAVPFDVALPRHQDTDWLLRATSERGAELIFVDRVLGIFHNEEQVGRVSITSDWRRSLQWIHDRAALVTPRAYAGFVLSHVSAAAARQRAPGAFFELLRDAFRRGRPRLLHVVVHCSMWALPAGLRASLRQLAVSRRD